MTHTTDPGWQELQALWRQAPEAPEAVHARARQTVRRQALRMRLALAADLVALAGVGALAAAVWRARPEAYTAAWIATVATLSLVILAFNLWNRWGLWTAVGESTRAFLDLALRRAQARLRLAQAVRGLVAVEIVAAGALLAVAGAAGRGSPGRLLLAAASVLVLAAAFLAWAHACARGARREIAGLLDLRAQVGAGDPPP